MPDLPNDSFNLGAIAKRCAEETERFFRQLAYDGQYCFELFRQALSQRNEEAWGYLYHQYESLVSGWITQHPQFRLTQESTDYFVNGIFTSMWKSCTPERFALFPNLPATLAYLKSCVHTNISNYMRKQQLPQVDLNDEQTEHKSSTAPLPTVTVLDQMERDELWHVIQDLLKNDKEARVMDLYFVKGLKPREIHSQHPDEFESVREVYRIKQNLMERLARNSELRDFYTEF